jgi:hypothetical protein
MGIEMSTMPEEFFQKALHCYLKGMLVWVEKASFSKEFQLGFHSGAESYHLQSLKNCAYDF